MSFLKNLEEYVIFVGSARILNGFKTNQESTRFCSRLRKTINKKEFAQRSTELCTEFKEKKKEFDDNYDGFHYFIIFIQKINKKNPQTNAAYSIILF